MKVIFLFPLLLTIFNGYTQTKNWCQTSFTPCSLFTEPYVSHDTAYRKIDYNHDHYKVMYVYDPYSGFVPTVNQEGPVHHPATIYVFRLDSGFTIMESKYIHRKMQVASPTYKQVGDAMPGIYVPGGCFEDLPEMYVKKALGEKSVLKDSCWDLFDCSNCLPKNFDFKTLKTTKIPSITGEYKYDVDSSRYYLFEIKDATSVKLYYYYKVYFYNLVNTDGWADAMIWIDRSYMRSMRLLSNCKVADTIMYKQNSNSGYYHQSKLFLF